MVGATEKAMVGAMEKAVAAADRSSTSCRCLGPKSCWNKRVTKARAKLS